MRDRERFGRKSLQLPLIAFHLGFFSLEAKGLLLLFSGEIAHLLGSEVRLAVGLFD